MLRSAIFFSTATFVVVSNPDILLAVTEHDGALGGLAKQVGRVVEQWAHPFGDDDLALQR